MKWDAWENRDLWERKTYISSGYKKLYEQAVSYINRGRFSQCGEDECFVDLESRVSRFEALEEIGAPDSVINDEVNLIRKSMEKAKAAILLAAIFDDNNQDVK